MSYNVDLVSCRNLILASDLGNGNMKKNTNEKWTIITSFPINNSTYGTEF